VNALVEEIEIWEKEEAAKGTLNTGQATLQKESSRNEDQSNVMPESEGRMRLPVLSV